MLLGTFVSQVNCNNKAALGKNKEHRERATSSRRGGRKKSTFITHWCCSRLVVFGLAFVAQLRNSRRTTTTTTTLTRRANKKSTRKLLRLKLRPTWYCPERQQQHQQRRKKGKAMYDFCVTYPWAILVAGSGGAGFMLKRSVPSLVSGWFSVHCFLCSRIKVCNMARKQPTRKYTYVLCRCAIVRYNGTKVYFPKRAFSERNVNSCRRIIGLYTRSFTTGGNDALGRKAIGAHLNYHYIMYMFYCFINQRVREAAKIN